MNYEWGAAGKGNECGKDMQIWLLLLKRFAHTPSLPIHTYLIPLLLLLLLFPRTCLLLSELWRFHSLSTFYINTSTETMAQESWKVEQEEQVLCINNCGFLGNSATMNLCSKCYEDSLQEQAGTFVSVTLEELPIIQTNLVERTPEDHKLSGKLFSMEDVLQSSPASQLLLVSSLGPAMHRRPQQLSQSCLRCFSCNKKLGLAGIKCRCGKEFCAIHRYSDKHKCTFNYRMAARAIIAKANPVVKAQKIRKL